jgi:hypothetical protein
VTKTFNSRSFLNLSGKPYNLLGLTAFILALLSFFEKGDALDINMHDTYFVIANTPLYWLCSITLFFLWGLYLLTTSIISHKTLIWVHTIATVLPITVFLIVIKIKPILSGPPRRYYSFEGFEQQRSYYAFITAVYLLLIGLFIIGQFVFFINLIIAGYKVMKTKLDNHI